MAQLNFEKTHIGTEPLWEARTKVYADFNIHIETAKETKVALDVSTIDGGEYDETFSDRMGKKFDQDFHFGVYPKNICIRCWEEPIKGEVTEAEE